MLVFVVGGSWLRRCGASAVSPSGMWSNSQETNTLPQKVCYFTYILKYPPVSKEEIVGSSANCHLLKKIYK